MLPLDARSPRVLLFCMFTKTPSVRTAACRCLGLFALYTFRDTHELAISLAINQQVVAVERYGEHMMRRGVVQVQVHVHVHVHVR